MHLLNADNDNERIRDLDGHGLRGQDKQQGDLRDQDDGVPEPREGDVHRKGPMGPSQGRRGGNSE